MRASRKRFHYVYKTTCQVTGKFYIGMHSANNLNDDYIGSGKRLWYSVKKYGRKAHIREIIEFTRSRKTLKERERSIVDEFLSNALCMNISRGGDGGWEHVNYHKLSPVTNVALRTDEIKRRCKVGSQKGMKKLQQWIAENHPENGFRGKTHTDEWKIAHSKVMKGKLHGQKNGSFGSKWMNKNGKSKRVNIDEITKHLQMGWIFGRKSLCK